MKISVCCPSYKRPKVKTLEYLPFCKVYVDCNEYEEYKKENGEDANIVSVPKGIQGNVARIRNYIIKTELKEGNDAVCVIDDDMSGVFYFENKNIHRVQEKDFMEFLYKYTLMAWDMNVYLWGVNVNGDKMCYREYSPFSTTSFIGAPFGVFLKGNDCWYDERLSLKEDYDMTLQQLNKHRKVLRVNKYYYIVKQSKQAGGCAMMRNFEFEKSQLELLQKKWGSKIVKLDERTNSNMIDYNPVIKAPIRGI